MFAIQQRDVPEQVVLTEQRHVRAADLPDWIRAAGNRLVKAAADHGGVSGSCFVVYHGPVSEDSEVLVEMCAPIGADREQAKDSAVRHEPAHREAYVRVKKSQLAFPQIRAVYVALAKHLEAHRIEIVDSPREVYLADVSAAGPDEDVCDVAFPIR
jgi:effector-binding domain-containing protein